jgi:uncharacterized RDD family membrane protein YckC
MNFFTENLKSLYNEIFGEKTDHPFFSRILAFLVDYTMFIISGPVFYYLLIGLSRTSTGSLLALDMLFWVTYFTLANSSIFSGQTVGKKLLRIRVVDRNGKYLGLMRSFVRSFPLVLLMDGYRIMYYVINEQDRFYKMSLLTLAIILFGTIYFPLLKTDRQGLHDILASSYVIPKNRNVTIVNQRSVFLVLSFCIIASVFVAYISLV